MAISPFYNIGGVLMTQLSEVEFITAKMVQSLKKHNICTVLDLLYSFPSKFDDYTIKSIDEITDVTKTVSIAGIVQGKASSVNVKSNLIGLSFVSRLRSLNPAFNNKVLRFR